MKFCHQFYCYTKELFEKYILMQEIDLKLKFVKHSHKHAQT